MANLDQALAVIHEYRKALDDERRTELLSLSDDDGVSIERAPRGWGGRLARVHATGIGIRLHEGKPVSGDVGLKVYAGPPASLAGSSAPLP